MSDEGLNPEKIAEWLGISEENLEVKRREKSDIGDRTKLEPVRVSTEEEELGYAVWNKKTKELVAIVEVRVTSDPRYLDERLATAVESVKQFMRGGYKTAKLGYGIGMYIDLENHRYQYKIAVIKPS